MKKPLLITIIVLLIIFILPVAGFLGWFFKEKKPMNIVILDKTVHSLERVKHKSLTWVLANSRFVKEDNNRKYILRKDYYGFFPIKPLRTKQYRRNDLRLAELIDLADNKDALYYADTYGVFFNDWYQGINRSRRSRKLYGGLNNNDYLLIAEMKKRNKLIILEHNTFDYPTDAYERYRVEEQYGMQTTGWTGQYYESLDSLSVPIWMINIYNKKYRSPWTYENAGIVLMKGENEIIVMEEGKHLSSALPFITTSEGEVERYRVDPKVAFTGTFDIVNPKQNRVISNFTLETTPEGADLLDLNFLTPVFPAVLADAETGRTIYFCGDFATGNVPPWTACFGSLNILTKALYSDDANDPKRFFWLYYKPLLDSILSEYYLSLEN
ncbi:MAG TPA: hypothetical protein VMW76_04825 [Bacteroidales bacterium]|nr:hypothetical protein [Bacteroidales bacterium]